MAVCGTCKRDMSEASSCAAGSVYLDGTKYSRIKYGTILKTSRLSRQPAAEIAPWKRAASIIHPAAWSGVHRATDS